MSEVDFKHRVELLAIIERNPGFNAQQLRESARLSTSIQTSTALQYLTERDLVKHDNGEYFPINYKTPSGGEAVMNVYLKGQQLKIYNAIPAGGGCDVDHLKKETGLAVATIQAQISVMKKKGVVASRLVHGRAEYSRVAADQVLPSLSAPAKNPPHKKTQAAKLTEVTKVTAVENILNRAVEQSQNNLDEYLASLADQDVLSALRMSRDNARKALEDYRARQS